MLVILVRIDDQIHIPLPISNLRVFKSVIFFRGEFFPGGGNDGGGGVVLPKQRYAGIQLCLWDIAGAAQNNGIGVFDLIIIEFAKIFHIHLALVGIDHSGKTVQDNTVHMEILHGADHIAEFTDAAVIKLAAGQSYMTQSNEYAVYQSICEDLHIPVQKFVNRSDMRGGSTLGPVMAANFPCRILDMGIPILSMHSARELMGVQDFKFTKSSFIGFYNL